MSVLAASPAAAAPGFAPAPTPAEEVELTIVMPCLNEAETLGVCIDKAMAYLARSGVVGEVLIADNGSTDGSQEIARARGARVVPVRERGYGAALIGGIEAAAGRYIIMGDADDSYDFSDLDHFVRALRGGAQLVMGNRFQGGIGPGAMPVLHRYLGNPALSFIGRLFFRVKVGDFHCGLRGFEAKAIRALDLRTTGMEFASEMVVRSALAGLWVAEVPTTLRKDGRSRPPHLKTWRDGWRHLKFLLMYNPRWLFLVPGTVLALVGAVLAGLLMAGPVRFADVVLDLNSFVFACFLMVAGAQLLTFGGLSRFYATVTGFLPRSPRADALVRATSTDRLVWLSVGFLILGGGLFGGALAAWAGHDFGALREPWIPRAVIGGITLLLIGVQTFFSAFLFGILEIPLKKSKG